MKKIKKSAALLRASRMIKSDRTGVSVGAEGVISQEVWHTLSDFFALSGDVITDVSACDKGISIVIKATAKSVKEFKVVV